MSSLYVNIQVLRDELINFSMCGELVEACMELLGMTIKKVQVVIGNPQEKSVYSKLKRD